MLLQAAGEVRADVREQRPQHGQPLRSVPETTRWASMTSFYTKKLLLRVGGTTPKLSQLEMDFDLS